MPWIAYRKTLHAVDAVSHRSVTLAEILRFFFPHETAKDMRTAMEDASLAQRTAHVCKACHQTGHVEGEAACPLAAVVAPVSQVNHAVADGYQHHDTRTWAAQRAAHVCEACHQIGHMEGEAVCPLAAVAAPVENVSHAVAEGYKHEDTRTWAAQRAAHVCEACHQIGHMEGEEACPLATAAPPVENVSHAVADSYEHVDVRTARPLQLCAMSCAELKDAGLMDKPDCYVHAEFLRMTNNEQRETVGADSKGAVLFSCTTKHLNNDFDPVWEGESFTTPPLMLGGTRLRLTVWDKDRFTADDFMGRVEVDLAETGNALPLTVTKKLVHRANKDGLAMEEVSGSISFTLKHAA